MFDWILRIGTISLLACGIIGALSGVAGVGPSWVSSASEAIVLFGFVGLVVLHRRGILDVRQGLT